MRIRPFFSLEQATGRAVGPAVYKTLGVDPIQGKVGSFFFSKCVDVLVYRMSNHQRLKQKAFRGMEALMKFSSILSYGFFASDLSVSERTSSNVGLNARHRTSFHLGFGNWNRVLEKKNHCFLSNSDALAVPVIIYLNFLGYCVLTSARLLYNQRSISSLCVC